MTLFDFGKTATQVEIQGLSVNASRTNYDNVRDQIVLNVKNAYYNLLQTQRNLIVAVDTMQQFQQYLDQANAFFRIGTKPKFDVTKAEIDFGNARLNVLKAENAVRSARITLEDVMGIPENADFPIVDNLAFQKSDLQLNDVLNITYVNRPDLRSIIAKREATEKSINLAKKGIILLYRAVPDTVIPGQISPLTAAGTPERRSISLSFPAFQPNIRLMKRRRTSKYLRQMKTPSVSQSSLM